MRRRRSRVFRRATCVPTTSVPASRSGGFTRFRRRARSSPKRGTTTPGSGLAAPTSGERWPATRSSATSTSPPRRRPATSGAATGPAPTSTPRACSASTPAPASASGTSRPFITASGTGTLPPPPFSPTSWSTVGYGRSSPRCRRPPSRTSLTGSRASPSGRSKSVRCRRPRCPGSGRQRPSPFRPDRRPSISRA